MLVVKQTPKILIAAKKHLLTGILVTLLLSAIYPVLLILRPEPVSAAGGYIYANEQNSKIFGPARNSDGTIDFERDSEGKYGGRDGSCFLTIQTKNGRDGGSNAELISGSCPNYSYTENININSFAGQANGDWSNHNAIKVGDRLYRNTKMTGDEKFDIAPVAPDRGDDGNVVKINLEGCEDNNFIDRFSDNHKSALLHVFSRTEIDTQCTDYPRPISLDQNDRYGIYFWWLDQGTITTSDWSYEGGSPDMLFKGTAPNFLSNSGQFHVKECKSTLEATVGESPARIVLRNTEDRSPLRDWGSPDKLKNAEMNRESANCFASKPIDIDIGNATKASGFAQDTVNTRLDPATNEDNDCQDGGVLGWIICPVLTFLRDATSQLVDGPIRKLLKTEFITNNPELKGIWEQFRNLANVFFVIMFLIIIYSQAASVGLDAYSVKKILPRLVIAAIAVQLSYYMAALMVDASNVLGAGIDNLIRNAGGVSEFDVSGLGSLGQVGAFGGVAIGAVFFFGAISLLFAGAMLLLSIFLVLILRQLLIWILVIAAPLALVAWILPNTESLAKRWFSNFTKILLMYPMIMGLWALGGVTSNIATNVAPYSAEGIELVMYKLIGIIAFFVPLFMIPFTFRWAGGAMAMAGGFVTGIASRSAKSTIGKSAEKKAAYRQKIGQKAKAGDLFKQNSRLDKLTRGAAYKYGNAAARAVSSPGAFIRNPKKALAKSAALSMVHTDEAIKEVQGILTDHAAMSAYQLAGGDMTRAKQYADRLRATGNHAGAEQVLQATRVFGGSESHLAATAVLQASQGKIGAGESELGVQRGAVAASLGHNVHNATFKAGVAKRMSEYATQNKQMEYSRDTIKVGKDGEISTVFGGVEQDAAMKKLQENAETFTGADYYGMKTSTPEKMAEAYTLNAQEAQADAGRLRAEAAAARDRGDDTEAAQFEQQAQKRDGDYERAVAQLGEMHSYGSARAKREVDSAIEPIADEIVQPAKEVPVQKIHVTDAETTTQPATTVKQEVKSGRRGGVSQDAIEAEAGGSPGSRSEDEEGH